MVVDLPFLRELAENVPDHITNRKLAYVIECLACAGIPMDFEVISLGVMFGVLDADYHNGILNEFLDN